MQDIAEKLTESMVSHYLDILATFEAKSREEGIDAAEQAATISDCKMDLLPIMTGLTARLSVQTLDDLLTLAAITVGLFGLSLVETAEQAQHWLYALPREYARQLEEEHLILTHASPSVTHAPSIPSPDKNRKTALLEHLLQLHANLAAKPMNDGSITAL